MYHVLSMSKALNSPERRIPVRKLYNVVKPLSGELLGVQAFD
jgi:hypothetical protein